MKAILFDLDGVLYQGDRLIPGAAEAVAWVRGQGIPHLFVTNTSSRPRSDILQRLGAMGIQAELDELITPPVAAAAWLREEEIGPVALFVAEATRDEFADIDCLPDQAEEGAAAMVIGDLGDGWNYATLNRALRLLVNGCDTLVALGMTRYWQGGDGLRLDVGAFIAALQYATGVEPVVLGKPSRAFFHAAVDKLGVYPDEVLMIGDDIIGDVAGAQAAHLRGMLVRTGKYRETDQDRGIAPDAIIDSVADLPGWWEEFGGG